MHEKTLMHLSVTERVAQKFLDYLAKKRELSHMNYLKCKLGIEVFLINSTKIIVIYLVASICQTLIETIIFHLSFFLIRFFAYGVHSKKSMECTIISCLILVGIPFVIVNFYMISKPILLILSLCNFIILDRYAPRATKKNPINDQIRKIKLKKKALMCNGILLVIAVIIKSMLVSNLLVLGGLTASVFILPIICRLIEKESV